MVRRAQLRMGAGWRARVLHAPRLSRGRAAASHRRQTWALVNVDLGPSTVVGIVLICSGAALYQVRGARATRQRGAPGRDVVTLFLGTPCRQPRPNCANLRRCGAIFALRDRSLHSMAHTGLAALRRRLGFWASRGSSSGGGCASPNCFVRVFKPRGCGAVQSFGESGADGPL